MMDSKAPASSLLYSETSLLEKPHKSRWGTVIDVTFLPLGLDKCEGLQETVNYIASCVD